MPDTITANHTVAIEDVEYQKGMLARLYRPSGAGPFPAALQVHGGAWTSKDRTDNDFMAKALAESGIFVASIDFRMPPVAPHPGSIQDINRGIRWLKANAREFKSRPEWVGSWGHVERRAPGAARGDARLELDLFGAPRPGRR
jgi:acetyl esterase